MLRVDPPSRQGLKQVSGHYEAGVAKALKRLALDLDTTLQALLAEAINDLFEKHRLPRIADEVPAPRGGAARRAAPTAARAPGPARASPGTEG